jgi:hypothetical protein
MVDMRGVFDDLVQAMLEVGLAKDDETQEATMMAGAPKGPKAHESKWTLVFTTKVRRFNDRVPGLSEMVEVVLFVLGAAFAKRLEQWVPVIRFRERAIGENVPQAE